MNGRSHIPIDGTNLQPITTVAVLFGDNFATIYRKPCQCRILRKEGRRPVEAISTGCFESGRKPIAGKRKEQAVTIGTFHQITVLSADQRPDPSTVLSQFRPFRIRRHPPLPSEIHMGGIIFQGEEEFSVRETLITTGWIRAIFRY